MYKEIKGDLITLAKSGKFDVVVHGCNCLSKMGSGLAPQMAKAFGCDKFEMERWGATIEKLGNIDYQTLHQEKEKYGGKWLKFPDDLDFLTGKTLAVVNAYTQYKYGRNHADGDKKPLDYEALSLCMRKINSIFTGKRIGLPQIGGGLARGKWSRIKEIIQTELKDCDVTVVIYNK